MVDALVARAFEVLDAQVHLLVRLIQFARAAPGVPLRLKCRKRPGNAGEIRAVAALVRTRIRRKFNRAARDRFLHDLGQVADLVILFAPAHVEGLVVNQVARCFERRQKAAGDIFDMYDRPPRRSIVHIEDISRGFLAALEAPRDLIHNQAFNVGRSEENYQIRDLAEIVKETVPGCTIEFAADAGPDHRRSRADVSRVRRGLPALPPHGDARRRARALYQAYKKVDLRVEDFEGPRYKRIDHIQRSEEHTSELQSPDHLV